MVTLRTEPIAAIADALEKSCFTELLQLTPIYAHAAELVGGHDLKLPSKGNGPVAIRRFPGS